MWPEQLRKVRRRAGLSQRALAAATGVPQSTVARIETGANTPSIELLTRLLATCGQELVVMPRRGVGIDRSQIDELLALTPAQRIALATEDAAGLAAIDS
jgi:transcriptional regulator with XRE-family HTH domain